MSSQPRLAATEFRTLLDELLAGASRGGLEQWIRAQGEALRGIPDPGHHGRLGR